jgi:hypothetical protein
VDENIPLEDIEKYIISIPTPKPTWLRVTARGVDAFRSGSSGMEHQKMILKYPIFLGIL